MTEDIAAVLDFWFGELDDTGMPQEDRHALWFRKNAATDALIGERFGARVEQALAGELDAWAELDRGLIALIILLDQFPRNLFRGSERAFRGDARALQLAQDTIASGRHQRLPAIHQVFLLLPLEHSESLDAQEECVDLFRELEAVTGLEAMAGFRRYAEAHRDVIERFGRFPHRNETLGRATTEAERTHLREHGGF
ncbi:DUF924 family protein [Parahaliea mediterranea]|uniref:DUF924 domain-containing protein n=1 Tax=Parahaliea mediterranea TaxID=651086 RepID=A0A939DDK3_9GAMM|nr:DUF924 family protein [Parahaliea mediterranea]MBN7795607.1 DUF924 domain-containing protein [Parahaliea mediterranea]